ncbi:hypothetical protein V8C86DRAFT_3083384 [Haematococcus lacustris]
MQFQYEVARDEEGAHEGAGHSRQMQQSVASLQQLTFPVAAACSQQLAEVEQHLAAQQQQAVAAAGQCAAPSHLAPCEARTPLPGWQWLGEEGGRASGFTSPAREQRRGRGGLGQQGFTGNGQ